MHKFLKQGQRNYKIGEEIQLIETKGKYKIAEVFGGGKIHFESYAKING